MQRLISSWLIMAFLLCCVAGCDASAPAPIQTGDGIVVTRSIRNGSSMLLPLGKMLIPIRQPQRHVLEIKVGERYGSINVRPEIYEAVQVGSHVRARYRVEKDPDTLDILDFTQ